MSYWAVVDVMAYRAAVHWRTIGGFVRRLAASFCNSVVRSINLIFILSLNSLPPASAVQLLSQTFILLNKVSQLLRKLLVLVGKHTHMTCQSIAFTALVSLLILQSAVESLGALVIRMHAVEGGAEAF